MLFIRLYLHYNSCLCCFPAYESLQSREETRNTAWLKEGWNVNVSNTGITNASIQFYYKKKKAFQPMLFIMATGKCSVQFCTWLIWNVILWTHPLPSRLQLRRSYNFLLHRSADVSSSVCVRPRVCHITTCFWCKSAQGVSPEGR